MQLEGYLVPQVSTRSLSVWFYISYLQNHLFMERERFSSWSRDSHLAVVVSDWQRSIAPKGDARFGALSAIWSPGWFEPGVEARMEEIPMESWLSDFATWWLIPLSKWVITPVINGISRVTPLITGVITHLLSGMSHQVATMLCRTNSDVETHGFLLGDG